MLLPFFAADRDRRRLGLQTLIAAADRDVSNVATRTISASRLAASCLGLGGEPDPEPLTEEEEEEEERRRDGGKEGGCWVMYGWRRRLRRLPPAIPSLRRAPWALTRTRTADGRVVVSREPAPRRACRVVATRLDGRLVLDLVEPSCPLPPPPPSFPRQEETHDDAPAADEEEADDAAGLGDGREVPVPAAVRAAATMIVSASSSPVGSASASPVPAVGCFEAVIRVSPLRKTMPVSLPRMVH